jgi:hypothetical protein
MTLRDQGVVRRGVEDGKEGQEFRMFQFLPDWLSR